MQLHHALHNTQSCPELAGEAVDYVEATPGPGVQGSQPAPILILAVDTTPDAADLEAVKTALVEVPSLLLLHYSSLHCTQLEQPSRWMTDAAALARHARGHP